MINDERGLNVLLWNCGGGPSDEKLGWLTNESWDVAVLVEVSKTGFARLEAAAGRGAWAATSSISATAPRRGRRYAVALLVRQPGVLAEVVPAPALPGRFDERVWAAAVSHPAVGGLTLAGFHAPNGRNGQADKERAYQLVADWLKAARGDVVIGLDTNTYTDSIQPPSEPEVRPEYRNQHNFQLPHAMHDLHDAFVEAARANSALREKDRWWTYDTKNRRHRWDQLWISGAFKALDAEVLGSAPGVTPSKAHRPLTTRLVRQ